MTADGREGADDLGPDAYVREEAVDQLADVLVYGGLGAAVMGRFLNADPVPILAVPFLIMIVGFVIHRVLHTEP